MTDTTQPELTVNTEPLGSSIEGAGLFSRVENSRVIRGLLLPFGQLSRANMTNTPPVMFSKGVVKLPADPSAATLYNEHDHYKPLGRATALVETERGIEAEFTIAATEEGDAYLANPTRKLSAEIAPGWLRRGEHATFAHLTGAAVTAQGAFESAALFSVAPEVNERAATPEERAVLDTSEWDDHKPNGPTDTQATAPVDTDDTPSESETEEENMADAVVPDGVVNPEANKVDLSANALFSALANNSKSFDNSRLAPFAQVEQQVANGGLFAAYAPLNDVTGTAAANTFSPQFIGEIYRKDAFVQTVLPLFNHDDLKGPTVTGWAWGTKPTVAAYAGDKTAIPSNTPTFVQVTAAVERIAGGHDIDRALLDLGNEEFWASYFRIMVEEYKKVADAKVLAKISSAATVVAPTAVAVGQDAGTMAIVDGALAVIAANYTPTFALVSPAIYRNFLVTPKDKVLEYLSSSMGLTEGQLGGFKIVPNATLAAKRVIVGSRQAATVYELPGAAPIQVQGLDVSHAGIDPAVYGYVATLINDATALASVTTL